MSGAILKIIVGVMLILGSAWWILQGSAKFLNGRSGVDDLITIINGGLPPLIFLIGLFVVWLELDELRIEKELSGKRKR